LVLSFIFAGVMIYMDLRTHARTEELFRRMREFQDYKEMRMENRSNLSRLDRLRDEIISDSQTNSEDAFLEQYLFQKSLLLKMILAEVQERGIVNFKAAQFESFVRQHFRTIETISAGVFGTRYRREASFENQIGREEFVNEVRIIIDQKINFKNEAFTAIFFLFFRKQLITTMHNRISYRQRIRENRFRPAQSSRTFARRAKRTRRNRSMDLRNNKSKVSRNWRLR